MTVFGRFLVAGEAEGEAVVLSEPLSFWGGVDIAGKIIDRSHPDCGVSLTGRILVMPGARGSSSSSAVLAEIIRLGVGPAAILLGRPDPILTAGSLVARALYGLTCPIVVWPAEAIISGAHLRITTTADGRACVEGRPAGNTTKGCITGRKSCLKDAAMVKLIVITATRRIDIAMKLLRGARSLRNNL